MRNNNLILLFWCCVALVGFYGCYEMTEERDRTCYLNPPADDVCRGNIERYYYDETKKKCIRFIWGGCGKGEVPPFSSREECLEMCGCKNLQLANE